MSPNHQQTAGAPLAASTPGPANINSNTDADADADADDIVITGVGVVSAAGAGCEKHWQLAQQTNERRGQADYTLPDFSATGYVADRRILRAISSIDAIGLAAFAGLCKDADLKAGTYAPDRLGAYVGAPPPSTFDHGPYLQSLEAARGPDGRISVRQFGKTAMSARPVTLLLGLSNNVLCYSTLMLDARGPNSNYTSGVLSGHLALQNAAKRLRRGQLDGAIAGAYSAHNDAVHQAMFAGLGLLRAPAAPGPYATRAYQNEAANEGTILADGGVFLSLERRAAATARGARFRLVLAGWAMGSDGLGPLTIDPHGASYAAAIEQALAQAGITPAAVGLVLGNASGIGTLDRAEMRALRQVFGSAAQGVALGGLTPVVGNLMEAGGLLELAMVPEIYAAGGLPPAMRVAPPDSPFGDRVDARRTHALVLRASPAGEYSAVVVDVLGDSA